MKKNILLILIGVIAISITTKISAQTKPATLKGQFLNVTKDSLLFQIVFKGNSSKPLDITLNENKAFEIKQELKRPGFYVLTTMKGAYDLYLEPGKTTQFSMDVETTNPSKNVLGNSAFLIPNNPTLKFSGDLIKENTFINKHKTEELMDAYCFYQFVSKDKLNDATLYKEKVTKIYNEQLNVLNEFVTNNPGLHKDFVYLKQQFLEFKKVSMLSWYEMRTDHYFKQKTKNIPTDYYDFKDTYDYNNEFLFASNDAYTEFLAIESRDADWKKAVAKIDKMFTNQEFKNKFLTNLRFNFSEIEKPEAKALFEALKTKITNKEYLKKVEESYANSLLVAEGAPVPNFTYNDVNGKKVSLSDFKGKFVYIDFWATWCAPCKAEIPFLKKLEKKYHDKDIVFLSISSDQSISAWKKMVASEKLGGVQVNIEGDRTLMDFLSISGIPRFTLIDKEGKIVRASAPRPSQERELAILFAISSVNK
ncbi:TlpA family protein disulfide reductase [Maribacter sp. 2304DJ31-5]|uniref:TlpA family protein disulfide reductase n=1 Tax=Maribacter sp. 2304DJ31-5 TaxID=3386273 RepID=UPI0039BD359E